MIKRLAVVVIVLAAPVRAARAQVTVNITAPTEAEQFAQKAGLDLQALTKQVQTQIETLFQTYRLKDYVRAFGDAQAFTTRGLGVDYGSNVRYVEVGVAASVAINGNKAAIEGDPRTQPIAGLATNLTLMAGVNLGFLGAPVTIFGNYFNTHGTYREYDAHFENAGLHAQLKLFGERRESAWSALVRWGGLDITTGFDHSHTTLGLAGGFERDIPIDSAGTALVNVNAKMGTLTLDTRTWSVPIEVTTNLRFLYILSAYVGGGLDFQAGGQSTLTAGLNADLTGKIPSAGVTQALGTVAISAAQSAPLEVARVRGMIGLQANVLVVKVFAQLNASPGPAVASVAVGARVVW